MADETGERMARLETTTADLRDDVKDNRRSIDQVRTDALTIQQWALEKARLDERAASMLMEINKLKADWEADREKERLRKEKEADQRKSDKRLIISLAVGAFVGPLLILLITVLINLRGLGGG